MTHAPAAHARHISYGPVEDEPEPRARPDTEPDADRYARPGVPIGMPARIDPERWEHEFVGYADPPAEPPAEPPAYSPPHPEAMFHAAIQHASWNGTYNNYDVMPALAYADYLEENGRPVVAELVRRNVAEWGDVGSVGLGGVGWNERTPPGHLNVWVNLEGGDAWMGRPDTHARVNATMKMHHDPSRGVTWGWGEKLPIDEAREVVHGLLGDGGVFLPHSGDKDSPERNRHLAAMGVADAAAMTPAGDLPPRPPPLPPPPPLNPDDTDEFGKPLKYADPDDGDGWGPPNDPGDLHRGHARTNPVPATPSPVYPSHGPGRRPVPARAYRKVDHEERPGTDPRNHPGGPSMSPFTHPPHDYTAYAPPAGPDPIGTTTRRQGFVSEFVPTVEGQRSVPRAQTARPPARSAPGRNPVMDLMGAVSHVNAQRKSVGMSPIGMHHIAHAGVGDPAYAPSGSEIGAVNHVRRLMAEIHPHLTDDHVSEMAAMAHNEFAANADHPDAAGLWSSGLMARPPAGYAAHYDEGRPAYGLPPDWTDNRDPSNRQWHPAGVEFDPTQGVYLVKRGDGIVGTAPDYNNARTVADTDNRRGPAESPQRQYGRGGGDSRRQNYYDPAAGPVGYAPQVPWDGPSPTGGRPPYEGHWSDLVPPHVAKALAESEDFGPRGYHPEHDLPGSPTVRHWHPGLQPPPRPTGYECGTHHYADPRYPGQGGPPPLDPYGDDQYEPGLPGTTPPHEYPPADPTARRDLELDAMRRRRDADNRRRGWYDGGHYPAHYSPRPERPDYGVYIYPGTTHGY